MTKNRTDHALVACSLWLHIGFIGATALAVGLLELSAGGVAWLSALTLAVSGGALAAASWSRGRTVLDQDEQAGARAATVVSTKSASRVSSKQTGRGAIAMLSLYPNRRRHGDLRRPTPR